MSKDTEHGALVTPEENHEREAIRLLDDNKYTRKIVIDMQLEIVTYKKLYGIQRESNKFYGDIENWSKRDTMFWESIDRADCKNYKFKGVLLRLTGGHKARQANSKCDEILKGLKDE